MKTFKNILTSALIVLASTAFALVAAELALRAYFKIHQSYLVEMWRYGRNHKQFVDDKRSHAHLPHTESVVMGKDVRIDRWGLRGADREPDPKRKRILVLGDSVTFGFGVGESETFSAQLEKRLPGAQVWNSGVGNYNTEQEFATLPYLLPRLHPDEVILGFFINDLEPVQKGSRIPLVQSSLLLSLLTQTYWSFADQGRKNFQDYYQHWFDTAWKPWTTASENGIKALQAKHIPLKVLIIPEFHALGTDLFRADFVRVAEFFRSRGIPVCDGEKYFPETHDGGREYWAAPDDSHPNATAHKILAQALVSCFYPKEAR